MLKYTKTNILIHTIYTVEEQTIIAVFTDSYQILLFNSIHIWSFKMLC